LANAARFLPKNWQVRPTIPRRRGISDFVSAVYSLTTGPWPNKQPHAWSQAADVYTFVRWKKYYIFQVRRLFLSISLSSLSPLQLSTFLLKPKKMASNTLPLPMPDLSTKVIIVTGSNGGMYRDILPFLIERANPIPVDWKLHFNWLISMPKCISAADQRKKARLQF
jgi:hypothetical protein